MSDSASPPAPDDATSSGRLRAWCRGVALSVTLLGLVLGGWFLATPSRHPEPTAGGIAVPAASLPLRQWKSPYLNTTSVAAYVRSQQCADCHAGQHTQWAATPHGQSLSNGLTEGLPAVTFAHQQSHRQYASLIDARAMHHRESLLRADGEVQNIHDWTVQFTVGSGSSGHSFLMEQGGFLVQSPLTWYTSRKEWGMSPGYDTAHQMGFQRIVSRECLACHSGHVETVDANPYRLRVHEFAIGCEKCHGPGSLHVAHQASQSGDKEGIDHTIVNPADLDRNLLESICHQCHLQGIVSVPARERNKSRFRPGLPLEDYHLEYERHGENSDMTIVGHASQLQSSRCYTESTSLTCVTCHHPHAPAAANRVAELRSACMKCHQDAGCHLALEDRRQQANNDCTICHMPKSPTEVPHVAFTQHRIGIHDQTPAASEQLPSPIELAPLQNLDRLSAIDRDRGLGLALFELARSPTASGRQPIDMQRVQELLQSVERQGGADAPVYTALAVMAKSRMAASEALEYAKRVLSLESEASNSRIEALRIIANIQFQEQKFPEALIPLRELSLARRNARDWFYLGLCEQNCNNTQQAISALEHSLTIDPAQQGAHEAIAAIYQSLGRNTEAKRHKQQAARLVEQQSTKSQPKGQ